LGCLHRDVDTMTRGLFRFLAHQHQIVSMRRPRPIGILLAGGVFGVFC
jgi:hypothetical protein